MSRTERATLNLGVLGGVLAFTLFALALATQGSQGLFQINRPAADYAALLIQRAGNHHVQALFGGYFLNPADDVGQLVPRDDSVFD